MPEVSTFSQADVKAAFAPLIERAEQAGWQREAVRFRDVAELGHLYPAVFWREFVAVALNVITAHERAVTSLDALAAKSPMSAYVLLAEVRALSEELAPYTTSPADLRKNLVGVAALYTDAVALAARFGSVGSA